MTAPALQVYRIALDTPGGRAVLDVPSLLGRDAAARRARWTAIAAGWGDVDEVTVAPDVECPTCHGIGEINVCPTGCLGSHVADYPQPCFDCSGSGVAASPAGDQ